jgi:ClpP class serine protease
MFSPMLPRISPLPEPSSDLSYQVVPRSGGGAVNILLDVLVVLLIVVVIVAAITPTLARLHVQSMRLAAIRRIERRRGSRVITLIHRQEAIAVLGVPVARYLSIDDSEAVLRAIRLTPPTMRIDLIVHTPGGLQIAAEQIAYALTRHRGPVTVFVPYYALSGGTLIALAADDIVMDANAVLGPIDPQLGGLPAASILKVLETKPADRVEDRTVIMADMARKALRQIDSTVVCILTAKGVDEARAHKVAEVLSSGRWTHDYPIRVEEATALGLPITTPIPLEIEDLMRYYPQAIQRRPSVEFVPLPYFPQPEPLPSPSGQPEEVDRE